MPLPVALAVSALPSIGRLIGGGANPNLRAQDKALADFFYSAGDRAGLQHMLDAKQGGANPGGSGDLYPTASHNYIRSLIGQVTDGQAAPIDTLTALLAQVNSFAGQGYPYSPAELTRARQILTAAQAMPAGSAGGNVPPPPAPASGGFLGLLTAVGDTASAAGAQELAARVSVGAAGAAQQQGRQLNQVSLVNRFTPLQLVGLGVAVVALVWFGLKFIRKG